MFNSEILNSVIPLITVIFIGYLCKKTKLFDEQGLAGLKSVVGNVTLPIVLFGVFYDTKFSLAILPIPIISFISFGLSLLVGFFLKRFLKPYDKYTPFLMSNAEVGMLGYALFGLLVGSDNLSSLALLDVGQTIFIFSIWISMLKYVDGGNISLKEVLTNMFTSKPFLGMVLGIIAGAANLKETLAPTLAGPILDNLISFISAPTSCVILIVVGYEFSLKPAVLKYVAKAVALRIILFTAIFSVAALCIFRFIPFDKDLLMAMMLIYSLPAPFILPVFANSGKDGEYISTTLSAQTMVTIMAFIGIAIYNNSI